VMEDVKKLTLRLDKMEKQIIAKPKKKKPKTKQ